MCVVLPQGALVSQHITPNFTAQGNAILSTGNRDHLLDVWIHTICSTDRPCLLAAGIAQSVKGKSTV
jgi:hypothetical protein